MNPSSEELPLEVDVRAVRIVREISGVSFQLANPHDRKLEAYATENRTVISRTILKSLLDREADFLLLDCREPVEHGMVNIEAATLIPMGQLPERVTELEEHRERHIVVHCHHGGRSLQVTQWLRQQGFPKTQNMSGGIDVWAIEIDRSLPRY
ncbi:MAG: hypothetical protein CMJ64_17690 [Planctomycetaceae bacterium]|nr:hypothetical protein [Planctomycetaceae bacterium]